MFKLTILLLTISAIACGQSTPEKLFVQRSSKEYKQHFSPQPTNIETAISQIDSDFTDSGRSYFKQLPEDLVILQFAEAFRNLQFTWKLTRTNLEIYSVRKTNSALVDSFMLHGASGDYDEIMRLIMMGLHRQLNNKPFTVPELYKIYGNEPFRNLRDSIRDVNPGDTIFGSWFNRKNFFKAFSWSTWFEVVSKDKATDSLSVRILKIEVDHKNVEQVKFAKTVWKVGDLISFKNRELRNWKEVISY